jgi:hypothetical protein
MKKNMARLLVLKNKFLAPQKLPFDGYEKEDLTSS